MESKYSQFEITSASTKTKEIYFSTHSLTTMYIIRCLFLALLVVLVSANPATNEDTKMKREAKYLCACNDGSPGMYMHDDFCPIMYPQCGNFCCQLPH